ncbi:MAG: tRNA (N6-threonylcarbamoyladenosine(37)-N6)-methyltransferase TrmO [Thermoproteus sp. AZ2]|jgi:tRNA-Thr(GGU) m(6)t(6)A37 methyltransferase TsaA|uniref:tRNA (N6-threonylcarbamoyladenosine(37)-N6)-methyltransferase TrmO n=1 Tax=Thermoproteus sp. AZ2 TaxID=1609232 RepID=A0ACC6UY60_9CREN|nr:MAG: methyltransferase [Thermoproteus sp. AZ2]
MISLRPIGYVEAGLPPGANRKTFTSIVRVLDEYSEGLMGLEEYSHVFVIWYMDRVNEVRLRLRPRNRPDMPEVGIFATRFPPRPNPIGLTVAELIAVKPPRIFVKNLDAWTGSPVLDIKPYDHLDVVERPRVPEWLVKFLKSREA